MLRHAGVTAIILALLAGCAADGPAGNPDRTPPPTSNAASTAPEPDSGELLASCNDAAGDGVAGVDITAVQARRQIDGSLIFIYEYTGEVPNDAVSVAFSVIANKKQYVYADSRGRKAHAVLDFDGLTSDADPDLVDSLVEVGNGRARISFPAGEIEGDPQATAGVNINGEFDTCLLR